MNDGVPMSAEDLNHAAPGDVSLFRILDDTSAEATPEQLDLAQRAYRAMKQIRLLDERMLALQRQGRIGFYGACTGQEASPVATALALKPSDWVFPALRESCVMLVRGFPLTTYIAQLFGAKGDVLKGRQMPSHMSGRSVNVVSWSSVIGSQLPHAVGAAWAAKLNHGNQSRNVVVAFLGDGATSSADFHSAMNFAAVFKTPCVFVCQNNQLAISVPSNRQTASASLCIKGRAYNVPATRIDGNDALAVHATVSEAAARAREGQGPTFIEAVTYRVGAHSSSDDPTRYRSQDELDLWLSRDPILRLRTFLAVHGALDTEVDAALDRAYHEQITEAVAEVESLGPTPRESMFDDVYSKLPWHLAEQREAFLHLANGASHNGSER
jgi:pyruvate dehydrogenase E1 component alpha subunit/2-oxoisovalerate dehydrogenase E1 component alpha subunit